MYAFLRRRELVKLLNKRFEDEEYIIQQEHYPVMDREFNTPIPYKGNYICIGYANIWNSVGCVEYTFKMYKPRKNGTILYEEVL